MKTNQLLNKLPILTLLLSAIIINTPANAQETTSKNKSKNSTKSTESRKATAPTNSENPTSPEKATASASASAAANAPINPQAFQADMLCRLVFDLTNQERRRAGLPAFKNNRYLANSAETHSRDMASRDYFNHKSKGILRRTDPRTRVEAAGYRPAMVAENLAMIPTFNSQSIQSYPGYGNRVVDTDYNSYNRLAHYAVQQWMESPGHRENILNGRLTELGVGVAIGIKGNIPYVYLTQNFAG